MPLRDKEIMSIETRSGAKTTTPKRRFIISTPWLGGVGGLERYVYSLLQSLRGDCVHLCAGRRIETGFFRDSQNLTLVPDVWSKHPRPRPWRVWRRVKSVVSHVKTPPLGTFDAYIHLYHGPFVGHLLTAKARIVVPCGNMLEELEDDFDVVANEAPGNSYGRMEKKAIVLPPPVFPMAEHSQVIPGLPDLYFLTVFNPYGPVKGSDVLQSILDDLPHPLVWCMSNRTQAMTGGLIMHPKLITLQDVSQEELRFLYENCKAYVCFSRKEGFGWAIADALLFRKPILSRRIGVLSFFGKVSGISYYETPEDLRRLLRRETLPEPVCDLSIFATQEFRSQLEDVICRHDRSWLDWRAK